MKQHSNYDLDRIDLMMIRELEHDGRMTFSELANKIGMSRVTARRKLNNLLDRHIIKIVAVSNPPVLGYGRSALIGLNVEPTKIHAAADKMACYPYIHLVLICSGRYDIMAWSLFPKPEDLAFFLKEEMTKLPGLLRSESMLDLENKKCSFTYFTHMETDAPAAQKTPPDTK